MRWRFVANRQKPEADVLGTLMTVSLSARKEPRAIGIFRVWLDMWRRRPPKVVSVCNQPIDPDQPSPKADAQPMAFHNTQACHPSVGDRRYAASNSRSPAGSRTPFSP